MDIASDRFYMCVTVTLFTMVKTDVGAITSPKRRLIELAPDVLRWARERADLEIADLAKKIPTKPGRVEEWEITGWISRNHAEKLARSTHTPFGYLFMKEPISERLPIVDFRTRDSGGHIQSRPSPGLLSTIHLMQSRQEWMRNYMIEFDIDPPTFVGQYDNKSTTIVSDAMRKVLGLDREWSAGHPTWEHAFSHLIGCMDDVGVMAVVNGIVGSNTHHKLDPDEFQGFALVDDYAPLIFVNGADYKAAQMFTAAHELAHIFIGAEGISSLKRTLPQYDSLVEAQCNRIAAEFLVPTDILLEFLSKDKTADQERAAKYFKVSSIVAARRMLDTGVMDKIRFDRFYADYSEQQQKQQTQKKGGGNYWNMVKYRVGKRFGRAIVRAVMEERLPYTDAYRLTGMRGGTFERYAEGVLSG